MSNKTLVIIPAYNEQDTLEEVVTRSLAYADLSVTDDGSKDATPQILAKIKNECDAGKHKHQLHIITHEKSTHIPRGLQDGIQYGVSKDYDFFITMDAGLSHDPDALKDFIDTDSSVDVVIGSRKNVENVPFYRRIVSKGAALVVNYALTPSYFNLFGLKLKDTTSGFRRYSKRAAEKIANTELESKAFDFHMEALAICVREGMSVKEIPITYVFSNSSFNRKVLMLGLKFGLHLINTKKRHRAK